MTNLIKQYRVTYKSDDLMFVVHHELSKSNMEFRMHESRLHYYDPRKENNAELAFVYNVAENKLNFIKKQIKEAKVAGISYVTLGRPCP